MKYYLHYVQTGSLRAVSDINMQIVKEIKYDTFGNILSDTKPTFTVPFGFAGGLYDRDTNLTRFGFATMMQKLESGQPKTLLGLLALTPIFMGMC